MTVGQAQRFEGDVEDRERVRSVSAQIMDSIISLSMESARMARTYRREHQLSWWLAARWWAISPYRLVRSWNTYAHARIR